MSFLSINYFIFLTFTLISYYFLNNKYQKYFILFCSIYFYSKFVTKDIFLIVLYLTLVSYLLGIILNKDKNKNYLIIGVIAILSPLILSKYFLDFFNMKKLMTIGLSFYTFEAISYIVDVYKEKINYKNNFVDILVYLLFFPTVLQGPIVKSRDFLPQFDKKRQYNYELVNSGLLRIIFGIFQKVLISNFLSTIINPVLSNVGNYSGIQILFVMLLYSIQIYSDFAGYSNIAIGTANCLGFHILENFKRPYFSKSISEFWKRWHISLYEWFKEYIFIPLGGSRVGRIKLYRNILIIFTISGIWHGSTLNFIIWGLLNGVYQIIEDTFKLRDSLKNKIIKFKLVKFLVDIINILKVYFLITISWIFFRIESFETSVIAIKKIFSLNGFGNFKFGIKEGFEKTILPIIDGKQLYFFKDWEFISIILGILFIHSLANELEMSKKVLNKIPIIFKYLFLSTFILFILYFGNYGPLVVDTNFIYFEF